MTVHLVVQTGFDNFHVIVVRHGDCLRVSPIEGRHVQPRRPLVAHVQILPILSRVCFHHFDSIRLPGLWLDDCGQVGDFSEDTIDIVLGVTDAHKILQIRLIFDDAAQHLEAPLVVYAVLLQAPLDDFLNLVWHFLLGEGLRLLSVTPLTGHLEPLLEIEGCVTADLRSHLICY